MSKDSLRLPKGKEIGPEILSTYFTKESSSDSVGGGYMFQFLKIKQKFLPLLELVALP